MENMMIMYKKAQAEIVEVKKENEGLIQLRLTYLDKIAELKEKLRCREAEIKSNLKQEEHFRKRLDEAKATITQRNHQIADLRGRVKKSTANHYLIKFSGRQLGAIGISYTNTVDVHATSEKEARQRLYEYYEHITNVNIKEV